MARVRNILFVMCDQLRADYLGCTGHPTIETPHIDALARRGVTFSRAFCQSPVCGPSRMSFYTGRYVSSHGATWNNVPLPVGELTLGDHLRPAGLSVALIGKTHMKADSEGMARLGIDKASTLGVRLGECGFDPWTRHDGLHPKGYGAGEPAYNDYLRARGYVADNPWESFANAAEGPGGAVLSGWQMRNARLPTRVREEDSETAYVTRLAAGFIREMGERPWCLHLSYIKPHWPYIAPAPYHALYGDNHVVPAQSDPRELENAHPVVAAFRSHEESRSFADPAIRRHVVPTYMGLIKQIDDHLGRLFADMAAQGRLDDTLIVFTSDHGDYLGDHGLGEKERFHEPSLRVPLIVVDPDPAADPTRGRVVDALAEAIDVVPTCLDALGVAPPGHIVEGRSLVPFMRGPAPAHWRDAAFSELDYAFRKARNWLGVAPDRARAWMVRTERWKYIHYEGFRPQLFDLAHDPHEFVDLGDDPGHAVIRAELHERLFAWLRGLKIRVTISDDEVAARTGTAAKRGIHIGVW